MANRRGGLAELTARLQRDYAHLTPCLVARVVEESYATAAVTGSEQVAERAEQLARAALSQPEAGRLSADVA